MFGKRKRAEALLAQSLYETLTDAEQAELNALLEAMPDLTKEVASVRAFVERVPVEDVEFDGDLRSAVMAHLHDRREWHIPILPHWAITVAAFVLVATGVGYWIAVHPPAAVAPAPTAESAAESPVGETLAESYALIGSRDFESAYARLAQAVDAHPADPVAAEACQRMADIAFDELQWYPEAFAGYDRLRHRYVEQFRAVPANFTRLNLLDEQRGADNRYAGLRALDAARQRNQFASLEDLAARNPATYLASAASTEMARIAAADEGFDASANPVRAMRTAQFRSRNPVAKSQLKLEVAHLLALSPDERGRAREMYEEVANGSVTTLAEAARKSLANFNADAPDSPRL